MVTYINTNEHVHMYFYVHIHINFFSMLNNTQICSCTNYLHKHKYP